MYAAVPCRLQHQGLPLQAAWCNAGGQWLWEVEAAVRCVGQGTRNVGKTGFGELLYSRVFVLLS